MPTQPQVGALIAGKYRLVSLLGEGGMGTVWIAENVVLQKKVALKLVGAALGADVAHTERFLREAVAASRVRHPAIVQIHDAGVDDGAPWIAMELLQGESLGRRLARGPLSLDEVGRFLLPVLDALAALHDASIVHRDLKPDNIFLEHAADGMVRPKLLDFGIAKQRDLTGLTSTGAIVGTAFYLSPEQARGARDLDGRSDLYAMGVLLFEALSGQMPYEARSITELIAKMFTEPPRELNVLAPGIPPSVATIVRRCLERDASARPVSARALREDLARALDAASTPQAFAPTGVSVPAPPPMPPAFSSAGDPLRDLIPWLRRAGWGLAVLFAIPCCCWCSALFRNCATVAGGLGLGGAYQWGGSPPIAVDVDGHAPTDAVGPIIRVGTGQSDVHIAAIDGATGAILWESESVGVAAIAAPLAVSDDGRVVLLATLEGELFTWDTRSGDLLASSTVRDAPRRICRTERGELAVGLGDGTVCTLDATGHVASSTHEPCITARRAIASFGHVEEPNSLLATGETVVVAGMHVGSVRSRGDGRRFASGWRDHGTEIPMIAILDGDRLVVSSDVPARDPMRARSGPPGALLATDTQLIAFYGTRTSRAMAGFDVSTGARLFDVDLDATRFDAHSAVLGTDRVWIERGHVLDGYDTGTGARVVRVGHD